MTIIDKTLFLNLLRDEKRPVDDESIDFPCSWKDLVVWIDKQADDLVVDEELLTDIEDVEFNLGWHEVAAYRTRGFFREILRTEPDELVDRIHIRDIWALLYYKNPLAYWIVRWERSVTDQYPDAVEKFELLIGILTRNADIDSKDYDSSKLGVTPDLARRLLKLVRLDSYLDNQDGVSLPALIQSSCLADWLTREETETDHLLRNRNIIQRKIERLENEMREVTTAMCRINGRCALCNNDHYPHC